MRKGKIKEFLAEFRLPLICARFVITYYVVLLIAKNTSFYNSGMVPRNVLTVVIAVLLVVYRFLSVAFVPALLILWLSRLPNKRKEG